MSTYEWHYVAGGTSVGPVSHAQMLRLIGRGQVSPQTLVWNQTMPQWEPAAVHFQGFAQPAPTAYLGPDGLYVGAPSRGFTEAASVCLRKLVTFRGRASRSEYWFFVLFGALVGAIAGTIDGMLILLGVSFAIFNNLVSLALLLPSLAVSVRRLHDINRSGWWIGGFYIAVAVFAVYLALEIESQDGFGAQLDQQIALIGVLMLAIMSYTILMIVFFCIRGTPGPNRYG